MSYFIAAGNFLSKFEELYYLSKKKSAIASNDLCFEHFSPSFSYDYIFIVNAL